MFTIALEFFADWEQNDSILDIPRAILSDPALAPNIKAFILVPSASKCLDISVNGETIFDISHSDEFPEFDFIVKQLKIFLT